MRQQAVFTLALGMALLVALHAQVGTDFALLGFNWRFCAVGQRRAGCWGKLAGQA